MSVFGIATKAKPESFFAVRWEVFQTVERLRQNADSEHLARIQSNILDCELRRIEAATEKASPPRRSRLLSLLGSRPW